MERGCGGQFPMGHSRMQQPVATPASSPPFLGTRRPRLLLLVLLRLRRHHPHLSRSSSPELSHPSNCPSSGGASPMGYHHHLLLLRPRERSFAKIPPPPHRIESNQFAPPHERHQIGVGEQQTPHTPPHATATETLPPHGTQLRRRIPWNHANLEAAAIPPRPTTAPPPPPPCRAQDHRMRKRRRRDGGADPPDAASHLLSTIHSSPAAAAQRQRAAGWGGDMEMERERGEWGGNNNKRERERENNGWIAPRGRAEREIGTGQRRKSTDVPRLGLGSPFPPFSSFLRHVADVDGFSSVRRRVRSRGRRLRGLCLLGIPKLIVVGILY